MSIYNKKNFVADFAYRTKKNLDFINKNKNTHKIFETTQMINSFLGLIIFPQERSIFNKISCDPVFLSKLIHCIKKNTYEGEIDFSKILRHLRNSIAHGKIEINSLEEEDKHFEINNLIFKDKNPKNESEEFIIDISIDDLKILVNIILTEIEEKQKNRINI